MADDKNQLLADLDRILEELPACLPQHHIDKCKLVAALKAKRDNLLKEKKQ